MAMSLPPDGKVVACDITDELYSKRVRCFFEEVKVKHFIANSSTVEPLLSGHFQENGKWLLKVAEHCFQVSISHLLFQWAC